MRERVESSDLIIIIIINPIQGQWRKITVDDLMPFDADGKCLLMVTPIQYELWSMILCKVGFKMMRTVYDGFLIV